MNQSMTESTASQIETNDRRMWWFISILIIISATAFSAAHVAKVRPLISANDRSRWCTVWSIVERGTYEIDEITSYKDERTRRRTWNTIDKATLDGHYYSTKPPLLATLVAGVYWCVKQTTGLTLLDDTALVTRIILGLINVLPMAAALAVFAMLVQRYAKTGPAKIYVLIAAAMATFLTTFQVTLNNHTIAAVLLVFALYPAMRILTDDVTAPRYYLLAGFFAAFACTNELPAALFGLALFGLIWWKSPRQALLYFATAACIPIAAWFLTNYIAVGTLKPVYTLYGTDAYLLDAEGNPTHWANPKGIDKGGDTPMVYLLNCTFGHHGIFSLSPIFLISLFGWCTFSKWRDFPLKTFLWLGLLLTVATVGFYLTRTGNYNYGGHTSGLRWTFWLIPLWLVAMIPVIDAYWQSRLFQIFAAACLAVSVWSSTGPLDNPWRHPWLFQLMERWEWIDYSSNTPIGSELAQEASLGPPMKIV